MRAAVQHVQHRRGQNARIDAAQVTVERNLQRLRDGARRGHGDGQNGIRAQLAFIRRAIELNHGLVDEPLVGGVHAFQLRRNHRLHIGHGLQNALAHVVALVAVAQFHGLMLAGGGARRHNGAAQGAAFQNHVRFHGRIAARIQNLAGTNGNNLSHIAPQNAVQQPVVIGLGRRSDGKFFSGSVSNRVQKALARRKAPLRPEGSKKDDTDSDSSKSGWVEPCGGAHRMEQARRGHVIHEP